MKKYRNKVLYLLESFNALNFKAIPREENRQVYFIAKRVSRFDPKNHWYQTIGIKLIFIPFVHYNDFF